MGLLKAKPFARAHALATQIQQLRSELSGVALAQAFEALESYRSRGHGGRHRTRNRTIGGIWDRPSACRPGTRYQPRRMADFSEQLRWNAVVIKKKRERTERRLKARGLT